MSARDDTCELTYWCSTLLVAVSDFTLGAPTDQGHEAAPPPMSPDNSFLLDEDDGDPAPDLVSEFIWRLLRSGARSVDEIRSAATGELFLAGHPIDAEEARAKADSLLQSALHRYAEHEVTLAEPTDHDRLVSAFRALEERGILCAQHVTSARTEAAEMAVASYAQQLASAGRGVRGYVYFREAEADLVVADAYPDELRAEERAAADEPSSMTRERELVTDLLSLMFEEAGQPPGGGDDFGVCLTIRMGAVGGGAIDDVAAEVAHALQAVALDAHFTEDDVLVKVPSWWVRRFETAGGGPCVSRWDSAQGEAELRAVLSTEIRERAQSMGTAQLRDGGDLLDAADAVNEVLWDDAAASDAVNDLPEWARRAVVRDLVFASLHAYEAVSPPPTNAIKRRWRSLG